MRVWCNCILCIPRLIFCPILFNIFFQWFFLFYFKTKASVHNFADDNSLYYHHQVGWKRGGTLNSGVTLNSINSYATRYLCFRLHTEGFCPPTSKFLKCPHNLWPCFFPKQQFSNEKNLMVRDKALIKSYFFLMCPGI